MTVDSLSPENTAIDDVSIQLQQLYEYILDDRRPEAVAETERLADQLGV